LRRNKKWWQNPTSHKKVAVKVAIQGPLRGIEKCVAFLHRVNLSGPYGYGRIRDELGPLWIDNGFVPEERFPAYRKKARKNYRNFSLNIFTNPIKNSEGIPMRPACFVEIHPSEAILHHEYRDLLLKVDERFPDLKVSSVEYAVDLYCKTSLGTGNLFWIIRKCLYVPWQREVRMIGGQQNIYGTKYNLVCHVDSDHKFYERGNDSDKNRKGWLRDDVNRVRLEHTVKRKQLLKCGISTLEDLIRSPEFLAINRDKWQFKKFSESPRFPAIWDPYREGCFQSEYLRYRTRISNLSKYKHDVKELSTLRSTIMDALQLADWSW